MKKDGLMESFLNTLKFLASMVTRIGGFRRKTRSKFRKNISSRGKLSLTRFLQVFNPKDKVVLKAEPAYQRGLYFPRFHGKNGIVEGMQGNCCKVAIKDGNKEKLVLVHPVHLKKI